MRSASLLYLAALLAWAAGPPGAAAAPRLLDAGPIGATVRGDGVRYIASASVDAHLIEGPVTVFDSRAPARRTIPTPAGCFFADIHHGTLLWSCPQRPAAYAEAAYGAAITYSLATGALTAFAPPRPGPPIGAPDGGGYIAIGDRWARLEFAGYHYAFSAYVNRVTGDTIVPNPTRSQIADPDGLPLVRRLCAGQLRPYVPDDISPVGGVTLGDLATAGRWAAATTYADADNAPGRVQFQRCGAKPRTLRVCRRPVFCSQPVIGSRLLAWVETRGARTTLVARSLRQSAHKVRIGRTQSLRIAGPITPLLVGNQLYVAAPHRLLRVAL